MDPARFFGASRLVIVAGKGGVGKTTVSATLARAAARTGLSALIVEVEGKTGWPAMFGVEPLGYDEVGCRPAAAPTEKPTCGPARSPPTRPCSSTSASTGWAGSRSGS